jgi:hypothetical protein
VQKTKKKIIAQKKIPRRYQKKRCVIRDTNKKTLIDKNVPYRRGKDRSRKNRWKIDTETKTYWKNTKTRETNKKLLGKNRYKKKKRPVTKNKKTHINKKKRTV